jgi:CO/xanthine dehydrogenase Mo-binding subunit
LVEPSTQPLVTSFCVQIAEVEIDTESGRVQVKRLVTAHDVGTIVNAVTHQGQIDGGVVQGVGFALMEETPLADGRVSVANLGEFKIPSIRDIAPLKTVILESPTGPAPYQGKAIGEIPNVPIAAAVANAIADAVGARIFRLPITAEDIRREITSAGREPKARILAGQVPASRSSHELAEITTGWSSMENGSQGQSQNRPDPTTIVE